MIMEYQTHGKHVWMNTTHVDTKMGKAVDTKELQLKSSVC